VPLKKRSDARGLSTAISRCAELIEDLGELEARGRMTARSHPEVLQATARFERINETLEKGLKAGHLTAAQQRSIARNFEGIAAALEKGAGAER